MMHKIGKMYNFKSMTEQDQMYIETGTGSGGYRNRIRKI